MPYIFYGFSFHRLKDFKQFTHLPDEPVSRTCIDNFMHVKSIKTSNYRLTKYFHVVLFWGCFLGAPPPDNFCSSYRFQNKKYKAIEKKYFDSRLSPNSSCESMFKY